MSNEVKWLKARKKSIVVDVREVVGDAEDIKTMDGNTFTTVKATHFIMRGVKGELYPIEKKTFFETYEFVKQEEKASPPDFFKELTIHRSITLKKGDDYEKTDFTLTVDLSALAEQRSDVVEDAKNRVLDLLDKWTDEVKGTSDVQESVKNIPKVDLAKTDSLPWKTFQKEPAKPDETAWVFRNHESAKELSAAIEKAGKDGLTIGNMNYTFSGNQQQFINRKPLEHKGARR
jgi:hypothetical protein